MSTHTYGSWCPDRNSRVSFWLSSVIQVWLRNSTQTRSGAARSAQSTMYCLFAREIGNQGGNCSRIAPSLPACAQRLERRAEPLPRLVGHLRVDVLEVDPVLARLARGLPQVGGQRPHRGGVLGEQAERLDVEGEPVRGPLRPGLRGLLAGQRVVGGVHLDQRELPRVVPEPLFRVGRVRRVPAGVDQRLVGPPRRAHPDLPHTGSLPWPRPRKPVTGELLSALPRSVPDCRLPGGPNRDHA